MIPLSAPIFLYGPPGTGKTTLGRLLAGALSLPFIDLDEDIERQAGRAIPDIFAAHGESRFREMEARALQGVLTLKGVAALGGGALLDPANRAAAEHHGRVVCLTAPRETLLARLQASPASRPLLAGDAGVQLFALLEARAAHYASFPMRLDTGGLPPEEAGWALQGLLGRFRVRGMGEGYDVVVETGALDALGDALKERGLRGPVGVASDAHVWARYGQRALESLSGAGFRAGPVVIPPGEAQKTVETAGQLWAAFLEMGLERGSTVVALGGGVVGDLAGFAAATYLRGVPWVAVPTSLLAMVDASLGGKTGVDLPQGKNLVGAFHPPRLVLADPGVLATLPEAEVRAGLAEVVKAAIIGDPALFEALCRVGDLPGRELLEGIVRRAMAVKIRVIEADPFERGPRAVLNLGHTVGHGVELASGFALRHGEAVAIGIVAEARLAVEQGLADAGLVEAIAGCLRGLGLPTEIPAGLDEGAVRRAISFDKKKAGGVVRFALPVRVGEVVIGNWELGN